jgi:hypothetical protein
MYHKKQECDDDAKEKVDGCLHYIVIFCPRS